MGYRDIKLAFSTSQQVNADAVSETTIDTEMTYPGYEKGRGLAVVVNVEKKDTAGTGIAISIMHKTTVPSTDVILMTATLLAAQLAAGAEIVIPLPQGVTINRHLALWYNITAGTEDYTLSAYLTTYPVTR